MDPRGENHVRERVRRGSRSTGNAGCRLRHGIDREHVAPETAQPARGGGTKFRAREDDATVRILDHEGESVCRIVRIDRHVRATGLEYSE